jgi:hypothetical protein
MTQSQAQARFDFPGFALVKTQDTSTHEVEVGTIEDGDKTFQVTMIRNNKLTHLDFAVSTVADKDGKKLWAFKDQNFDGVGLLAFAGDAVVIVLATRGKDSVIERVVPFSSLVNAKPIGLREMIKAKMGASFDLDIPYRLTETEAKVEKIDEGRMHAEMVLRDREASERRASERDAEKIRKQDELRAKQVEREQRVARIMVRERVVGYTALGDRRHGVPVVENEWQILENGTFVILVDAIGEDGTVGKLLESFKVVKERGRHPVKVALSQLVDKNEPSTEIPEELKPTGEVLIEMKGDIFEVGVYGSLAVIKQAHKAGLNGGAFVTTDERDAEGKVTVYSVTKESGPKKVGSFIPLG